MSTVVGYLIGQHGELSGLRLAIPEAGLVIGREPKEADVVLEDAQVSRRHAQLTVHDGKRVFLVDLQSTNGTFVNGRKITAPVELAANDKVDFGGKGKAVFVFETADTPSMTALLNQVFGENFAPVEWKVGDNILGIYDVTGILGQGGMGRVYKVHHKSWNMDLAVKSPLPGLFTEEKAVENFIREAETWVNLNLHPHIVQCFYVRTIGGIPRIFSEYVPGGTLHDWIKQRKLTKLDQILDVAIQFAWGLHAAHEQGIVHQDVKPLNVLMTPDGIVKVSDFGLARSRPITADKAATTPDNMVTMAGVFTKAYVSPEQARGAKLSRKTDIWSWAVSVLEMFTGKIVWENGLQAPAVLKAYRSLIGPKFIVKMPKDLAILLERCLSTRPAERPKDMHEIANALENVFYSFRGNPYSRTEPKLTEHLADSLNNRAVSLMDLGKQDRSLELWRQALQSDSQHILATYNMNLVLWRCCRVDDDTVLNEISRVINTHRQGQFADYLTGLVHLERGDCESAIGLLSSIRAEQECHEGACTALEFAKKNVANSRRQLTTLEGHTGRVYSACLSRDGRWAITGSADRSVRIWETATARCIHVCEGHTAAIRSVCFDVDERFCLSGSDDGTIRYWDRATGHCLRVLRGHSDKIVAIRLVVSGRRLLSVSEDQTIRTWDLADGTCLNLSKKLSVRFMSPLMVLSDKFLLSGGEGDTEATLLNLAAWRDVSLAASHKHNYWVASVSLSSDSRLALTGGGATGDTTVKIWSVDSGKCLGTLNGHSRSVDSVCFSPDSKFVLSGGADGKLKIWERGTMRCLSTLPAIGDRLFIISPSQDGKLVLCAGYPHGAHVDHKSGKVVLSSSDRTSVALFSISLDMGRFAAPLILSRPQSVEMSTSVETEYHGFLENAKTAMTGEDFANAAQCVRRARSLKGCVRRADAISIWADLYKQLQRVCPVDAWQERLLDGHSDLVSSVSISADNQFVLSASWDATLKLWELATGRCLSVMKPGKSATCAWLSNDGHFALSGVGGFWTGDDKVKLWDATRGECLHTYDGLEDGVASVFFSADHRFVCAAGGSGKVRVWEVTTETCVRSVVSGLLTHAAFSSDARSCLIGKHDSVEVYDLVRTDTIRTLQGCSPVSMLTTEHAAISGNSSNGLSVWELSTGTAEHFVHNQEERPHLLCATSDCRFALTTDQKQDKSIKFWEISSGRLVRELVGHPQRVTSLCVSIDGRYVISGDRGGNIKVWQLDWELVNRSARELDEVARRLLTVFLRNHTPCAVKLPYDRKATRQEIVNSLIRVGKPVWSEDDLKHLLHELACAGYGWLRPDCVQSELMKLAGAWAGA